MLLGECSLDLVEMVCGRAPHVEEWVPLNSEGDLRLSLNYDSVGAAVPVPGDSVSDGQEEGGRVSLFLAWLSSR